MGILDKLPKFITLTRHVGKSEYPLRAYDPSNQVTGVFDPDHSDYSEGFIPHESDPSDVYAQINRVTNIPDIGLFGANRGQERAYVKNRLFSIIPTFQMDIINDMVNGAKFFLRGRTESKRCPSCGQDKSRGSISNHTYQCKMFNPYHRSYDPKNDNPITFVSGEDL